MVQRVQDINNKNYLIDYDIEKIMLSLTPETKDLPPEDKQFFESKVKFLIGKEIKLSNIPLNRLMQYTKNIQWVIKIMRYPQLFSREYVRFEIVNLLAKLGLRLSIDALAWKYGPMGFQHKQEHITQELVNIPTKE